MHNPSLVRNPMQSRQDVVTALQDMLDPLLPMFSPGNARLVLSRTGANSDFPAQEIEALTRMLWGLAPLLAGGGTHAVADRLPDALGNGTDPSHPEYWGFVEGPCIRAVEMAPLGVALALAPDTFWHNLPAAARDNLYTWLSRINEIHLWPNNWLFFRVLTNLGFETVGRPWDREQVERDLEMLDSWYLGDGWYSDGGNNRRDYYIAFAFHFYGLIYAATKEQTDPERCRRFKERARQYAPDYMYWFGRDGASFPFGRSLTYRFAVASLWGALAFAGVEALPWGVVKGLYLRNLRWWLNRPIFTETGLLTLGYGYPNLIPPETYSSPGSPYWAVKAFLPLALPETHPFWQAEEEPLPELDAVKTLEHARMVMCHDPASGHVTALSGGQIGNNVESHMGNAPAKYSKFAYSNCFGFSLARDRDSLSEGAFDSMLALSRDGHDYRVRAAARDVKLDDDVHFSRWELWGDVRIETWLVPAMPWHVRLHRITTPYDLHMAEGGFAVGRIDEVRHPDASATAEAEDCATAQTPLGFSGIRGLREHGRGNVVEAACNTNLIEPLTYLPMLVGQLAAGTHVIASAVLGIPGEGDHASVWNRPPSLRETDGTVTVLDPEGRIAGRIDIA